MRFRRYTKIVSGIPARPLVAVLGPTASGKSALALLLARQFNGEIVNCDSLQIYRGFDIGTAKTPPADRLGIPHHLIDILDPLDSCDAGRFASLARPILSDVSSRGRLPVLAGGTGFYLRATLDGLSPGPQRDPALRQRLLSLEARRPGRLHRLLLRLDPPTAARIHLNDHQKLVRALEICLLAGRPASSLFSAGAAPLSGFAPLKLILLPEREALRAQIALRTRQIFESGLVEEVRQLLCQGLPATAKPLEAIGYKEALGVIEGRLPLNQAIQLTFFATCQYAKRQVTWFRREPGAYLLHGFGGDLSIASDAAGIVRSFLQSLHSPPSLFSEPNPSSCV
jgi:tRNA dimethylallyltransferase